MRDKPELKVVDGKKKFAPCPTCSKPSMRQHIPFCSARCAQIDLGKWLNGDYAIPAHEAE
ncbi:MAG: DNA gyrase inhibitor YacG [Candidatus Puniceispirillaceae bacterium]